MVDAVSYIDKISSFITDFDEKQNDFNTARSLKQQMGEALERKGEQDVDLVGVKLPLAEAGRQFIIGVKNKITAAVKSEGEAEGGESGGGAAAGEAEYVPNFETPSIAAQAGEDNPFSFSNFDPNPILPDVGEIGDGGGPAAATSATSAGESSSSGVVGAGESSSSAVTGGSSELSLATTTATTTTETAVGEGVGEAVGLISLETIGSAIPILGAIAGITAGIVELVKGHHEEKRNANQSFQMPSGNIDIPSYNPGVS